jgi:hypothetical protein
MSAIADFRIIETFRLEELKTKAVQGKKFYVDYIERNTKKLKTFDRPGYIFAHLLIFLEEKGIVLLKGLYHDLSEELSELCENSILILTFDHRQQYLDALDPENFSIEELITFNADFSEDVDAELAHAEMEGISALHNGLSQLAGDVDVLLLSIG